MCLGGFSGPLLGITVGPPLCRNQMETCISIHQLSLNKNFTSFYRCVARRGGRAVRPVWPAVSCCRPPVGCLINWILPVGCLKSWVPVLYNLGVLMAGWPASWLSDHLIILPTVCGDPHLLDIVHGNRLAANARGTTGAREVGRVGGGGAGAAVGGQLAPRLWGDIWGAMAFTGIWCRQRRDVSSPHIFWRSPGATHFSTFF